MKKKFLLIMVLLLCASCTRVNDKNYDDIVMNVTRNNSNIYNTTSLGYKYYLPLGVSKVYDKDYNQKFKVNDTYMYLYVDIVSYYYKNNLNLSDSDINNCYYYSPIKSDDNKTGYVKITKEDDNKYFIKIVYNYAKIESYVNDYEISNTMIILDSISYNDKLVENILLEEYYSSSSKEYKIKKPENTESKFSEYLSEYVADEESKIPDLPEY